MKKPVSKAVAVFLCMFLLTANAVELGAAQPEDITRGAGASYYDSAEDGAVAEDGYYIRKVSKKELKADTRALQDALDEAAENATVKTPYKIVVEPASYTVKTVMVIPSNTYLYLDGVTFKQEKNAGANMLKVGMPDGKEKGYCYENVTIYGGTFDKNGNAGTTLIKVGHTSNFTMEKTVLTNIKNAHFMEIGGVKGCTLRDCTFQKAVVNSSSKIKSFEAVQFDILVEGHIGSYEFEDIPNEDILVEGCTFRNVSGGVGSHNAILNCPIRNIVIQNNTFQNLKSVAVSFMDPRNCTITGNTMTAVPRGVMIRSIRESGAFFGTSLNKNSKISKKYIKPEKDQKLVISNNTISCTVKDADSAAYATNCIFVLGQNLTNPKKVTGGDKMPKGDYFISGAVISHNKLTTTTEGIVLWDTKNSTIDNNTITCKGTGTAADMITLDYASTNNKITKNTVKKAFQNAIGLHNDSSASSIANNTLTAAGSCGILFESSTAETISGNKVTKPKGGGIILDSRSGAKAITKNIVTSAGADGINIANTNTNLEVSGNTVKSCVSSQILVNSASGKTISVSNNKLTGTSTADGILAVNGTVFVSGNTITSSRFAVLLTDNVKGTVVYNNCSGNQNNELNIGFGEAKKYMSKPASVKAKASGGRAAKISWKAVNGAAGYQVFRSTKQNGTYTKVADVSKTSYTNTKLKAKTTYYYKVIAYQKSNNGNLAIASDYSKPVSLKTK